MPIAALAAVIIVSSTGLFDFKALRELFEMSRVEFLFSVGTTLGVLLLGVLPGVLLAIVLSLLMLLAIGSKPHDSVLGRVPGMKGFHELEEYPEARTVPGLVLFRFDSNLVFYNADYFKERVLSAVESACKVASSAASVAVCASLTASPASLCAAKPVARCVCWSANRACWRAKRASAASACVATCCLAVAWNSVCSWRSDWRLVNLVCCEVKSVAPRASVSLWDCRAAAREEE